MDQVHANRRKLLARDSLSYLQIQGRPTRPFWREGSSRFRRPWAPKLVRDQPRRLRGCIPDPFPGLWAMGWRRCMTSARLIGFLKGVVQRPRGRSGRLRPSRGERIHLRGLGSLLVLWWLWWWWWRTDATKRDVLDAANKQHGASACVLFWWQK